MLLVIYLKGEPYNKKKSKTTKVARHNSNISEMWKTGFKTRQNEQRQCGAQSSIVETQIFLHWYRIYISRQRNVSAL